MQHPQNHNRFFAIVGKQEGNRASLIRAYFSVRDQPALRVRRQRRRVRLLLRTPTSPLAAKSLSDARGEFGIPERPARVRALLQFFIALRNSQVRLPVLSDSGGTPPLQIQESCPVFASRMSNSAGPRIVCSRLHHPRTHGVAVDVRQGPSHVRRTQGTSKVPVLPQVAGATRSNVEILGVASMHAAQQ